MIENKYKLPNDAFNRSNEQKISEQDIILKLTCTSKMNKNNIKRFIKEEENEDSD